MQLCIVRGIRTYFPEKSMSAQSVLSSGAGNYGAVYAFVELVRSI